MLIDIATKSRPANAAAAPMMPTPNSNHASGSYPFNRPSSTRRIMPRSEGRVNHRGLIAGTEEPPEDRGSEFAGDLSRNPALAARCMSEATRLPNEGERPAADLRKPKMLET
jgi:hypothetical protein